jgi:predicted TIM-barrel fold metal-dependent hydrolase
MIVDAHTHIYEHADDQPARPAGTDDLLRGLDAAGIDMAVVIPLPGVAGNEYVRRECDYHPDRLAPLYTPEFDDPARTLEKLRRYAEHHFLHGVKIHPRLQGVTVNDLVVREVVGFMAERGRPVLFDNFPHGRDLDNPALLPMAYHRLAKEFPTATLVLAHAGGHKVLDAFMVAKANPNVLLETSFTLDYYRGASVEADLAFAVRRTHAGRVLYGSDFPSCDLGDYLSHTRRRMEELSAEQQRAFYGETAARVYRLERESCSPRTSPMPCAVMPIATPSTATIR